jgi:hypothetical protein
VGIDERVIACFRHPTPGLSGGALVNIRRGESVHSGFAWRGCGRRVKLPGCQIPGYSNAGFPRPRPKRRFPLGLPSQPPAFSSRGSGTGTSCVVLCATARPPARLSWTRSSLPSLLSTAPRSVRQIATSRGSLRSGGRTLSRRTVEPIQSTGGTCRPRNADDLRALSKKTTRMTMPADVESYSTKSRPCCLRVIDLDIILVDPWHA